MKSALAKLGAVRPLETAGENQILLRTDPDGYVVGGSVSREYREGFGLLAVLRSTRDLYPIDPADIVMPPGWPVDPDGRGLSVLEVEQGRNLTTQTEGTV